MKLASSRLLTHVNHDKGDIFHFLKSSDDEYSGFGEIYFSAVNQGATKGWKMHSRMTCNLCVVTGLVEFNLYSDSISESISVTSISSSSPKRVLLTIPPNVWFSFTGLEDSIIANLANIPHDPLEATSKPLTCFPPFAK